MKAGSLVPEAHDGPHRGVELPGGDALAGHEEGVRHHVGVGSVQLAEHLPGVGIIISAANRSIGSTTGCTITEKAPTRAFSWLKAPTSAFIFKTLLRHYAKQALTPQ